MKRIMLIEDDPDLRRLIAEHLARYGYFVYQVLDFKNVEDSFEAASPDLILLDINLPCFDGFYLCRIFRKRSDVPIIIMSARSGDMDQILGIELGADDYIIKPFSCELLLAKVKAALRRSEAGVKGEEAQIIRVGRLTLALDSLKLSYEDRMTDLTKNEFKLIRRLMENAGRYLMREELLQELWDDSCFVDDNTLTVNVTRLKSKLCDLGLTDIVKTKRGMGYMLDSSLAGEVKNE